MPTAFAAALALAAVIATYFFCVRPAADVRRRAGGVPGSAAARSDLDRELAQLGEEVRVRRTRDPVTISHAPPQPRSAGTVDATRAGAR